MFQCFLMLPQNISSPKNSLIILMSHGIIKMRFHTHPGSERHIIFCKHPWSLNDSLDTVSWPPLACVNDLKHSIHSSIGRGRSNFPLETLYNLQS